MNNGHDRRKARPLRRIARRAGLLRDPQSVRYRLGQISRVPRLPGARLDQRRHGVRGGQGRRRRRSRLRAQPLNADFEAGFARDAEGVQESARLCIGAGVSGFSIEDYTGDPKAPLYGLREATDRLRAARAAIDASGEKVLLTARSEAILRQAGGLPEALRRLEAYAAAGADVLYAPLVRTPEEVAEVVRVAGKLPVNVLAGWPGFTKSQLEDLGVKRISVGGALARAARGGFQRAAKDIAEHGRFDAFADLPTMAEITAAFGGKG
jgi:2-methylisocitrate lyase-like PEP mutase family enzyme